jgi:hypothetical protein
MKILFAILMALSLSACSSLPGDIPCDLEPAHYDSNAIYIPAAYSCPTTSPRATYAPNECSWIKGYFRKDGVYVSSHTRCKYNFAPTSTYSSKSSYSKSPCVTSNCGPVKVKGYYRKNGTYVRPHTRRAPRRR